ncbi:unnamed protein product [Sphagnum balticum]
MNTQEINELIFPFQIHYNEEQKRNYYFNLEAGSSHWELPTELDKLLKEHLKKIKSTEQQDAEKKNIYKYLPKQLVKKERKRYLKFMEECTTKPAASRGCCANGVNCRFYHRIPIIDDCNLIDNSKDIFGRARFSTYREDMKGVGSFAKVREVVHAESSSGQQRDILIKWANEDPNPKEIFFLGGCGVLPTVSCCYAAGYQPGKHRFIRNGLLHFEVFFVRTKRLRNQLLLQLVRYRAVVLDLAIEHPLVQPRKILVA